MEIWKNIPETKRANRFKILKTGQKTWGPVKATCNSGPFLEKKIMKLYPLLSLKINYNQVYKSKSKIKNIVSSILFNSFKNGFSAFFPYGIILSFHGLNFRTDMGTSELRFIMDRIYMYLRLHVNVLKISFKIIYMRI